MRVPTEEEIKIMTDGNEDYNWSYDRRYNMFYLNVGFNVLRVEDDEELESELKFMRFG